MLEIDGIPGRPARPWRLIGVAFAIVSAGTSGCSSKGTHGSGANTTASAGAGGHGSVSSTSTGLGMPPVSGDAPSDGGTITFQSIGAPGWYPSRRDPQMGPCDAFQSSTCCLAKYDITSDALTPWDEDLIMTLRGPMEVKQLVVYQPTPNDANHWSQVSSWDVRNASAPNGMAFQGNKTETTGFTGAVGTECLVNVSTNVPFPCGSGSSPYCPPPSAGKQEYSGWAGSKLFVMLATMRHAADVGGACSTTTTGNWYDAPWIGLSVGELVRAGSFVSCHCYAKDPNNAAVADGCGQFNVFEVVNDNNSYKNLDVFSTDMIDYAGYVGEGPCGPKCNVSSLGPGVDLINKSTDTEAMMGAVASPQHGPGAAFRRPEAGYRYFVALLDVGTRTVQLAVIHPDKIPTAVGALLPGMPSAVDAATIDAVRGLRLPK